MGLWLASKKAVLAEQGGESDAAEPAAGVPEEVAAIHGPPFAVPTGRGRLSPLYRKRAVNSSLVMDSRSAGRA